MARAVDFGKVAVLMGGRSAEREISLLGGQAVLDALTDSGVDAHGIDVGHDIMEVLVHGQFDRAFIVLHGRDGEDGVIQGALKILGIPFTGSDVQGSSLGMDKYRCKLLWQGVGLPTPGFVLAESETDLQLAKELGYPLAVKPVREGSSLGISRVEKESELLSAWQMAQKFDPQVLIEQWIEGGEYTVAILDTEALPVIKLETSHAFYDFAAKYESDDTRYLIPCGLDAQQEFGLQQLALNAFQTVGATGWGRVDLMLDVNLNPSLIEVNTVPGMTNHSLVPMAARANGIDFGTLVLQILAQTLEQQ